MCKGYQLEFSGISLEFIMGAFQISIGIQGLVFRAGCTSCGLGCRALGFCYHAGGASGQYAHSTITCCNFCQAVDGRWDLTFYWCYLLLLQSSTIVGHSFGIPYEPRMVNISHESPAFSILGSHSFAACLNLGCTSAVGVSCCFYRLHHPLGDQRDCTLQPHGHTFNTICDWLCRLQCVWELRSERLMSESPIL